MQLRPIKDADIVWGETMESQDKNIERNILEIDTSFYKMILDNSSDPIFCYDITGKYLFVNNAFSATFKKQPSDIIGKRIWDIFPGEEGDHRFAAVKHVFETGDTEVIEVKVQAENKLSYFSTSVIPVKTTGGHIEKVICISRNITDRKQAEEAYKESESRYKGLFDHSSVAIGYYNCEGIVLSYNNKAAENMGGKPEDYVGKSFYELFPKDDADVYMIRLRKAVSDGKDQEYEDYISLSSGTRWYYSIYNRITDSNGDVVGIQIISQDITSRKQSEDILRENDAKHETMIANIGDVIGIIGVDGIIKYKSPNIEKWFGWKPADLVGTDGSTTIHPEDAERIHKMILELLEKDNAMNTVEYRYRCKSGTYIWIELTAVNCVNNPSINGILVNYHNIAERKKNEEDLQNSEERHRLLITQMHQGLAMHEVVLDDAGEVADYRFLDVNESFERLTGLKHADVVGKTVLEIMPDTETYWIEKYGHVALTGEPLHYENYSQELGKYFEAVAYSPRRQQFAVIVSDITHRKALEQEALQFQNLLKTTLLSVGDGVISTDKCGNVVLLNRVAEDLTGWTQDEALGSPITKVFNIFNEYTRKKCENIIEKVLSSGRTLDLANHTILMSKDGTEKPIEDSAAPIVQENGEVVGVVLVFRDFTEKKKKQDEIEYLSYHDQLTGLYNRRYYEELLMRIDTERNLPITLIMLDVNGLKLTNDAFGHKAGDEQLIAIADILKTECRSAEIVSRIGGDEFVILLPQTDAENANVLIRRIKKIIDNENTNRTILSVSIGYAVKKNASEKMNDVFKEAEDAMYTNKLYESASMRSKTIDLIMSSLYEKNHREMLHSQRVSEICESIAIKMNLHIDEIYQIKMAGLMHDIGKIGVGDAILNKQDTLSNDEWTELKRHSEIGYRILSSVNEFSKIAEYVLEHHERWDGKGYPKGINGEEIKFAARIIAIADAYDAMTSDRVYRKALNETEAIREMIVNRGHQFDPAIVDIFIEKVLDKR